MKGLSRLFKRQRKKATSLTTSKVEQSPLSPTSGQLVEEITRIRARNNGYWMAILEVAFKHAPTETRIILTQILEQDKAVSERLAMLCRLPDEK